MAEVAHGAQHDFWRPPMQTVASVAAETNSRTDVVEACDRCETEFIVGSRYCHNCGAIRPDSSASSRSLSTGLLRLGSVAERFGLSLGAFIAFALGILCLLGALTVGLVFSARTLLDWQAVQLWRIEWLLAAVAAFGAGLLLKRAR